jgi:hypothetical protein
MRHARSLGAVAALLLVAATLQGCLDPLHLFTYEDFSYDKDFYGYSGSDIREYETYTHEATVIFEAWDFSGTFQVEIFDDHDHLIYARTFTGDGGHEYHVDDTHEGHGGRWHIELTALSVVGEVALTIY